MPDCKTGGEEAKHQEWLGAGLVFHIVLDGVRNEVLHLKEDLQMSILNQAT